jgi:hypothetical protein
VRATLPLRIFAALCLAMGVFPLANVLTGSTTIPWWDNAVRDWLVRGVVLLAFCALAATLLGERVDVFVEWAKQRLLSVPPRTFAIVMAAVAFAAAALLSRFCFSGQPFTSDEMAQEWHARILVSGRLAATPESLREFFNTAPVFDRDGRWFSQYPVGGPAFIAIGLAIGATWLVNPLLLGVATWQLYRFLDVAFDELTARVTTILFVVSPMVLIMAASQMNHMPALTFTLIALAALVRWDHATDPGRQMKHAILIGLSVGIVGLVRPLDAAVAALVVGAFQLWSARRAPARWRSIAMEIAAGVVPLALLLWANARTTGSPLLFGYEALNGPAHALGFHVDPNGVQHTPFRGVVLMSGYLMRLDRFLFEWPIPAMLIVIAGLVAIERPSRWDLLLVALAAGILLAYGAYWFDGFFSGPRFLFTALPAFVYFAARAPAALSAAVRRPAARRMVLLIVPACVAASWLIPSRQSSALSRIASYRSQRTKLKTDIEAQLKRDGVHDALVLVTEPWRGRLEARLRVLGITQFRAERILSTLDACALQTALDAEDTLMARSAEERAERVLSKARAFGTARLEPGLPADQSIALVPGSRPTPRCLREFQRDLVGTIAYPIFLAHQRVGSDGRVAGNVIFVRDLGERNQLLRTRFGNRVWYSYRVPHGLDDTTRVFLPLVELRQRRSR